MSSPPNSQISERRKPPLWLESTSRQGSTDQDQTCEPGKDQEPDDSAADNLDPLQLRPQLRPECIDLAFELRLGGLQFLLDKHDVALCRDPSGDTGVDRLGNGFGMGLLDARAAKALDRGQGVECNVSGYVRRSFRFLRLNVAPFRPDFQSGLRLAQAFVLALFLALPSVALAQSGAVGGEADGQGDLRAALGECPRDLLRRAWTEMLPLEAEAVEREVVKLCTERVEAIARFLDAQARLDGALAVVRIPSPIPVAEGPAAAEDRLERLRDEIATLRGRIARLEGGPEAPETDATLADLRDELATAEADLALLEESGVMGAAAPADVLPPVLDVPGSEGAATAEAPVIPVLSRTDDGLAPSVMAPGTESAIEPQAAAAFGAPPLGTEDKGAEALGHFEPLLAAQPGLARSSVPPDRRTGWQVIYAVRAGDGPWQVRLQGSREIAVRLPGATGEVPDTIHWQPVLDPPVTLWEGESLEDGLTLLEVNPDGVLLDDPFSPDGEAVLVPFRTNESFVAGKAEWEVRTVGAVEQAGTVPEGLTVLSVTEEGVLLADPAAPAAAPVLVPFGAQETAGEDP